MGQGEEALTNLLPALCLRPSPQLRPQGGSSSLVLRKEEFLPKLGAAGGFSHQSAGAQGLTSWQARAPEPSWTNRNFPNSKGAQLGRSLLMMGGGNLLLLAPHPTNSLHIFSRLEMYKRNQS